MSDRVEVSVEDFVVACERVAASDTPTIEAIAEATGQAVTTVRQRRYKLKKAGYPLTELPKQGRKATPKATLEEIKAKFAELKAKATAPVEPPKAPQQGETEEPATPPAEVSDAPQAS